MYPFRTNLSRIDQQRADRRPYASLLRRVNSICQCSPFLLCGFLSGFLTHRSVGRGIRPTALRRPLLHLMRRRVLSVWTVFSLYSILFLASVLFPLFFFLLST